MKPLFLITNDDGITSPGLAAAARAVHDLADLLIVAPREQQSGMGRSLPALFDGRLFERAISMDGHQWRAYGANASPAQAVHHGLLELADRPIALVISGINYGENIGFGVTISGTVGAAMEAAALGIPALAVSLQTEVSQHRNNDPSVDFSAAMHFTRMFALRWLAADRLPDVDLIKVEVPAGATPETPWRTAHLERQRYFLPTKPERAQLGDEGRIGYEFGPRDRWSPDSDASVLARGEVAVTPMSLDNTSRIALERVQAALSDGSRTQTDEGND